LYAQFLAKRQRSADAVKQLDIAVTHAGDSPLSHYNLGLVYMELGEHDKALAQAHKALAMGYERPELRAALERTGRWRAPPAEAAAPGPAASAASAAN
jgi:tetratricopeptide (TPR) repeat protein